MGLRKIGVGKVMRRSLLVYFVRIGVVVVSRQVIGLWLESAGRS